MVSEARGSLDRQAPGFHITPESLKAIEYANAQYSHPVSAELQSKVTELVRRCLSSVEHEELTAPASPVREISEIEEVEVEIPVESNLHQEISTCWERALKEAEEPNQLCACLNAILPLLEGGENSPSSNFHTTLLSLLSSLTNSPEVQAFRDEIATLSDSRPLIEAIRSYPEVLSTPRGRELFETVDLSAFQFKQFTHPFDRLNRTAEQQNITEAEHVVKDTLYFLCSLVKEDPISQSQWIEAFEKNRLLAETFYQNFTSLLFADEAPNSIDKQYISTLCLAKYRQSPLVFKAALCTALDLYKDWLPTRLEETEDLFEQIRVSLRYTSMLQNFLWRYAAEAEAEALNRFIDSLFREKISAILRCSFNAEENRQERAFALKSYFETFELQLDSLTLEQIQLLVTFIHDRMGIAFLFFVTKNRHKRELAEMDAEPLFSACILNFVPDSRIREAFLKELALNELAQGESSSGAGEPQLDKTRCKYLLNAGLRELQNICKKFLRPPFSL